MADPEWLKNFKVFLIHMKKPESDLYKLAILLNFTKMLSCQQNLHQTMLFKCLNYLEGPSNPFYHMGRGLLILRHTVSSHTSEHFSKSSVNISWHGLYSFFQICLSKPTASQQNKNTFPISIFFRLSSVSLAPVVINLYFLISPQIFVKIQMDPMIHTQGTGETDSWKKPEVENLVSDSLQNLKTVSGCGDFTGLLITIFFIFKSLQGRTC